MRTAPESVLWRRGRSGVDVGRTVTVVSRGLGRLLLRTLLGTGQSSKLMHNSTVLQLDAYRERRDLRVKLATSLNRVDPGRAELLEHLTRLAQLVRADRAAIVWVDEYGPGLVHPHVVVDLLNDRPRRSFSAEPFRRAWESGVPGVVEIAGGGRVEGAPWTLAVALGSDGTRSWFLAADAVSHRAALASELRDRVMFVAGECSSIVLHRDLDAIAEPAGEAGLRSRPRFAGWPILQDIESREDNEVESGRIALRFIVARLPRLLVDDDLTMPLDRMRQQAERAREELRAKADGAPDPESELWERVLDAYGEGDLDALGSALIDLGTRVENATHLHGAAELYGLAYEMFAAIGRVEGAVEAARFAGRTQRRLARWDEAHHWYGIARNVAEAASLEDKVAVVLDGVANIHRDRGNHPAAREALREAMIFAERSGDLRAIGSVEHGLLALEHVAGNLDEALAHGWRAVTLYPAHKDQVEALASLAGALIDAGELPAAEDAWMIVARTGEDDYFRLFALEALAYTAALRGDRGLFARRAAASDSQNWEEGPALAKAEVLLHRGLALRALGLVEDARTWLDRAVAWADQNGFGRTLFTAEAAVRELCSAEKTGARQVEFEPSPATIEVRSGLRRMREDLVEVLI